MDGNVLCMCSDADNGIKIKTTITLIWFLTKHAKLEVPVSEQLSKCPTVTCEQLEGMFFRKRISCTTCGPIKCNSSDLYSNTSKADARSRNMLNRLCNINENTCNIFCHSDHDLWPSMFITTPNLVTISQTVLERWIFF